MTVSHYLGIESLSDQVKIIVKKFLVIQLLNSFLFNLSSTFYILYAIDNLGFIQATIITSTMLMIQLIFDYPSGSLGDFIGQKWVMIIAYTCHSIAFILLSIAQTFPIFLLIAIFSGLGNAQSSGAIESWFDSNYKGAVKRYDNERKIYGFLKDRVGLTTNISTVVSFIIGGILATVFLRQLVFFLQFILTILLILYTFQNLNNIILEKDNDEENEKKKPSYFQYLKAGINFMFLTRITFFFILGLAIYRATWLIWGEIILAPLYFSYTGSDFGTSVIRSSIFLIEIPLRFNVAKCSNRFKNDKFPIFLFIHLFIMFPAFLLLFTLLPPQNKFNLIGFLAVIFIMTISNSFIIRIGNILIDRIIIDLVPSECRNSIYSLIPTLVYAFGIPLIIIIGPLVEYSGLIAGIAFVCGICFTGSSILFISMKFKSTTKIVENIELTSQEPIIGI